MTSHTKQPLLLVRPIKSYEMEMGEKSASELPLGWLLFWIAVGSAMWTGLAWWVLS